ncbi:hypothetical protein BT93_L5557 [Corymbia citriodora subsp. variegata]|uniref:Uncharacterized protein n=1 Tax=Corymbia citriodora subsp. variegata TaxID=360336 RepID=A0A8T0CS13_CORYI|nr:hypothetical protein BT93_L5557 [Corymbia citriodora subsp. variegata]
MNQSIWLPKRHRFDLCPLPLRQRRTGRRGRIVESWDQVLSPVDAVRVVARPRRLIHQQVTGVARVRPVSVDPRARRRRLQRCSCLALVVPVRERVRGGPGDEACEVDHHPVDADVTVGRHQRRALRAVLGLVERPRALPRALRLRVAHPDVREPRAPAVDLDGTDQPLDGHVGGGEHDVDGVLLFAPGSELDEVLAGEGLPERVALVEDLPPEREGEGRRGPLGGREVVVLIDRLPPLRDGRRGLSQRRVGRDRGDEVGDDGALGGVEAAVPDEVDGDLTGEERAIVVLHGRGLVLDQLGQPPGGGGHVKEAEGEEELWKSCVRSEEGCHCSR